MKMKNENEKFAIKNLYVYEKWASMILKKNSYKKWCIAHIFISNLIDKGQNLGQVF